MPFVVVAGAPAPTGPERERLAARLCPYTETLELVGGGDASGAPPGVTLWATASLARTGDVSAGRWTTPWPDGTAQVSLRIEGSGLLVETDPLGTCPLWIARRGGGWVVSPEAKALAVLAPVHPRPDETLLASGPRAPDWSPFEDVRRVPPGCALFITDRGVELRGKPRCFDTPRAPDDGDAARALGAALMTALPVSPSTTRATTGAFVSGGIDSSLACALARRQGPVASFTLGTDHGDEFPGARALADGLGCAPHEEVQLGRASLLERLDEVVFRNEVFDGLTAEILVQVSALADAAGASCTRVVTGYGSDLLFDGMLRHAAYMQAVGLATTADLIERTRWTGELSPFVTWSRGLSLQHVFWQPSVMDAALSVPREACFVDGIEKHVLRRAAVDTGLLPDALAWTPKIGLSDGTGAARALSEALGIEGVHAYHQKSRHALARWKRLF